MVFSGRVRVYQNINSNWLQMGNDIEGTKTGDYLGVEICLSGDGLFPAIGSNEIGVTSENDQLLNKNGTDKSVGKALIALGTIGTEESFIVLSSLSRHLTRKSHRQMAQKQISHQ